MPPGLPRFSSIKVYSRSRSPAVQAVGLALATSNKPPDSRSCLSSPRTCAYRNIATRLNPNCNVFTRPEELLIPSWIRAHLHEHDRKNAALCDAARKDCLISQSIRALALASALSIVTTFTPAQAAEREQVRMVINLVAGVTHESVI